MHGGTCGKRTVRWHATDRTRGPGLCRLHRELRLCRLDIGRVISVVDTTWVISSGFPLDQFGFYLATRDRRVGLGEADSGHRKHGGNGECTEKSRHDEILYLNDVGETTRCRRVWSATEDKATLFCFVAFLDSHLQCYAGRRRQLCDKRLNCVAKWLKRRYERQRRGFPELIDVAERQVG